MKKLLTLEDYEKAGELFWPKYHYVAKELGEGAKPADILSAMASIADAAGKLKDEEKLSAPFGFNKKEKGDD
mgnify:CR=1 FL=1